MSIVIIIIHVVVCVALIMIVLLQTGKGADMGAAFGGGASQTLFGTTGASTFLSKATTVAAIIFMVTSLALAYMSGQRPGGSTIMTEPVAPIEQPALPQTTAPQSETDTSAAPAQQDTGTAQAPTQQDTEAAPAPAETPANPSTAPASSE